jgi:glutaredoxin
MDEALVVILSRRDCPLCDEAIALSRRLRCDLRFRLIVKQIEDDSALHARYGMQVPVVFVDGREIGWGSVTAELLCDALKRARRRRPISRILSRLGLRRKR